MRITCPFCGARELGEFSYLGDAAPRRPAYASEVADIAPGAEDAFFDYVFLRDNPAGELREFWYHGGGCRAWLVVTRNTLTHEIAAVGPAPGASGWAA